MTITPDRNQSQWQRPQAQGGYNAMPQPQADPYAYYQHGGAPRYDAPAHPTRPLGVPGTPDGPIPRGDAHNVRNNKRWLKWTAGLAAAAALAGFGGKMAWDTYSEPRITAPVAEAGVNPTEYHLSPEAVSMQEHFDRVSNEVASGFANELDKLKPGYNLFRDVQHGGTPLEIPESTADMSPRDILKRTAAKEFWIANQYNEDIERSMADFLTVPGTDARQGFIRQIDNSVAETVNMWVPIQNNYFENGTFVDANGNEVVTAHDTPTQIISHQSAVDGDRAVAVFQFVESGNGNTGEWLLVSAANETNDFGWVDPDQVKQATILPNS